MFFSWITDRTKNSNILFLKYVLTNWTKKIIKIYDRMEYSYPQCHVITMISSPVGPAEDVGLRGITKWGPFGGYFKRPSPSAEWWGREILVVFSWLVNVFGGCLIWRLDTEELKKNLFENQSFFFFLIRIIWISYSIKWNRSETIFKSRRVGFCSENRSLFSFHRNWTTCRSLCFSPSSSSLISSISPMEISALQRITVLHIYVSSISFAFFMFLIRGGNWMNEWNLHSHRLCRKRYLSVSGE